MQRFRRRSCCSWKSAALCGMGGIAVAVLYVVGIIAHGWVAMESSPRASLPAALPSMPPFRSVVVALERDRALGQEATSMPSSGEVLRATAESPSAQLRSAPALYRDPFAVGGSFSTSLPSKPFGNRRAVIPLLLTSITYHGTSLLATTLQGWILKFLIPQGNVDLIVFYDIEKIRLAELLTVLRLHKRPQEVPSSRVHPSLLVNVTLSQNESDLLGDGYFLTAYHPTYAFRVHPVRLPFPDYIVRNMSLLSNPSWMRCGCPPVCPQKRATVDYVQGTRWYTLDLFLQPIVQSYSFWIKLDVDIWMMREPQFNFVETLLRRGAVFAHTGYIYNGHGCSNELHKAIEAYLSRRGIQAVAAAERWWQQDDNVYYSNFVISSMAFHLSQEHLSLARELSEYPNGFFRYRWTEQSLFHKVFGVFFGPHESDFLLDWTSLRCSKRAFRKGAIFYHSKGKKKSSVLRQCTDI